MIRKGVRMGKRQRKRVRLALESTAVVNSSAVDSRSAVVELVPEAVTKKDGDSSLFTVAYIRAGWSLNGRYYPENVLKTEGVAAAVPGTLLFIDHASPGEDYDRPVGSVAKLAAAQEGAAWWDESTKSVCANVRVFRPHRESLNDMKEAIGLSVRAWVLAESGEAEGKPGEIITSIEGYKSVDFVTVPAAGGRIISVSESFGGTADEARNSGHWLEARLHSTATEMFDRMFGEGYLTKPERLTLSGALGDALNAFATRVETEAPGLYDRDPYADAGPHQIETQESGDRVGTTEFSEGKSMTQPNPSAGAGTANTGTDGTSTDNGRAVTAEARAAVAESERDQLAAQARIASEAQRTAAEASARAERAESEMRRMVGENAARSEVGRQLDALTGMPAALVGLMRPRIESSVSGRVPFVTEGDNRGQVDTAGLTAAVTTAIESERTYAARVLEAAGVGAVNGLGATKRGETGLSNEAASAALTGVFKDLGLPDEVAGAAGKVG